MDGFDRTGFLQQRIEEKSQQIASERTRRPWFLQLELYDINLNSMWINLVQIDGPRHVEWDFITHLETLLLW